MADGDYLFSKTGEIKQKEEVMHPSSLAHMGEFIAKYITGRNLQVFDIGAYDVNGSYRDLFDGHKYTGADVREGPNVDIVLKDKQRASWKELEDNSADVVISGQTLEHVEDDFAFMKECARVMKPGAVCCHIAPSAGPVHENEGEWFRNYTNERFERLAVVAGLEVVELETKFMPKVWKDCVFVGRKPVVQEAANEAKSRKRPGQAKRSWGVGQSGQESKARTGRPV